MPFDAETVDLCDSVAALVTPILEEKRKNDRLLIKKIWKTAESQLKTWWARDTSPGSFSAGALVRLTLFFTFATGEHRVTANVTLEGSVQRAVPAPDKGFIFEAPVRARRHRCRASGYVPSR